MTTKPKPIPFTADMVKAILDGRKTITRRNPHHHNIHGRIKYKVGDICYVRESFIINRFLNCYKVTLPDMVDRVLRFETPKRAKQFDKYADKGKWQSSMFMPREAARLHIRIKSVRVERLKDITEEDAIKEGVELISTCGCTGHITNRCYKNYKNYNKGNAHVALNTARDSFASLWDSIYYKKAGCAWADNPIVEVYEFERVEI